MANWVEAAMRAGFQAMPPYAQRLMLDMLGKPGTPERAWWDELLTAPSKPLA